MIVQADLSAAAETSLVRDANVGWRFIRGEHVRAEAPDFDDSHWARVPGKLFPAWNFWMAPPEALETVVYIAEVASRHGAPWIENQLRVANEEMNPELFRVALKMATDLHTSTLTQQIVARVMASGQ